MPNCVLDASATLPWCFQDEATAWSAALLQALKNGDDARVPAHWAVEVSNAFLSALKRRRFAMADLQSFWNDLAQLPISVEPALSPAEAKSVLTLAANCNLTIYDATYLELAIRLSLPIATLDTALGRAASTYNVAVL